MIISQELQYVYIGMGRTGSNSMNSWLCEHYQGESVLFHHSWDVPEECRDFLIFTIVRNPYDRTMSSFFTNYEKSAAEIAALKGSYAKLIREEAVPRKDGSCVLKDHNVPEVYMNQFH